MAEMCYGVVSEGEVSATACKPSSRAARRRRMEIRRFKFVIGVAQPEEAVDEDCHKRQKLEAYAASFSLDGEENGSEMCGSDDGENSCVKVINGRSKGVMVKCHSSPSLLTPKLNPEFQPKFGFTSLCGRRRDMEDAVSIHPAFHHQNQDDDDDAAAAAATQLHYFAVYDGHGCSHVAIRCRERLHELVKEEIGGGGGECDWRSAMGRSFTRMDKEVTKCNESTESANCRCELQSPECDAVGSTAVVAIVTPDKIIVANCGDSRAVLCRKGKAVPLSSDHKPDRPDELYRIQAAGGRVIFWDGPRVLGVLAMSRAIGDNYLKPYVSCDPEVTITDRTRDDDCLILASDGLWDVVSNDTACGVARMCLKGKSNGTKALSSLPTGKAVDAAASSSGGTGEISDQACSDASMLLTKLALARHSTDNVSVVVVDLRRAT